MVRLERLGEHLGHGLVHAAMKVDSHLDVVAAYFANGGNAVDHRLHLVIGVNVMKLLCGIHLDRLESAVKTTLSLLGHIGRTISANPGVHANAIAGSATKELVNRHTKGFSLDVPEGHLDSGDDGAVDGAATEEGAVQLLPETLDLEGVATHDALGQLLGALYHRASLGARDKLTPSRNAFIGVYLDKDPAGFDFKELHTGNFHIYPLFPEGPRGQLLWAR